jgi:hypothetical protein
VHGICGRALFSRWLLVKIPQKGKMMTEENATTKLGRIRRLFRWVFLTVKWLFVLLLAILLIAGLYFHVPPKVTTLIAIILATLTIVPKRARKWIWLSFAVIVIALIVWVFLPEEDGDWRPYTFDEELAVLEAERAIPDEQNAATIYNKLLETYDPNDFYPDFMDDGLDCLTMSGPWSSQDYPELAEWLKDHKETITIIMRVCERNNCQFPNYLDPVTLSRSLDRSNAIRLWARLLLRSANNDLGDGHIDKALEKYLAVVQFGKHQSQQSTMIDWMVGLALEAMGIGGLNQLITEYDLTENQFEIIEDSIGPVKNCWSSDWTEILETEILESKNELGRLYEINTKGKVRLNRDPKAYFRKMYPDLYLQGYWAKKLNKSMVILKWFCFSPTPQEAAKFVNDRYSKFYAMAHPDFDWQQSPQKNKEFNLQFFPPVNILPGVGFYDRLFFRFHDIYLRYLAVRRGCRLLVEIKRYRIQNNHWPDSLSEISDGTLAEVFVDPTNNDSFVYLLTDNGFTLYSKGKNGIDEGGEYKGAWPEDPKPDDFLIWPPYSRK